MATLREVAEISGVSLQTVSRILNGGQPQRFRESTRARVQDAARRLRYRPSAAAQAMRSRRLSGIGWFSALEQRYGHVTANLWSGIQQALAPTDYHLITGAIPLERPADDARLPAIIHQRLVAGLLVHFDSKVPAWIPDLLARERSPAVWINTRRDEPCAYPDDETAAFELTRAFLERGHRRVLYADFTHGAAGRDDWHYSAVAREVGYARAMGAADLVPRVARPADPLSGEEAMAFARALLTGEDRPTAIINYEPFVGLRSLLYADQQLHPDAPTSIAGFSPEVLAEGGRRCATAYVPEMETGRRAMALLLDWIASGTPPAPDAGRIPIPLFQLDCIEPPPGG